MKKLRWRKKDMEPTKIERIEKPEPEPTKSYLLTIFEGDNELNIGIQADDILQALLKFAETYKDECAVWGNLTLNIQEIEIIQ